MEHRRLHAGQQQLGVGGEDHIRPLAHRVLNGLVGLLVTQHILIGQGAHLVAHGVVQQIAAVLVVVDPLGGGRRAAVDKCGADLPGGREGEQGLFHRVLQHQGGSRVLQPVEDLRPDLGQLLGDLRGELVAGLLVAENLQIDQQRHRDIPPVRVLPVAGVPEHIEEGTEGVNFLRAPGLPVGAAQHLQQLPVLPRTLEDDEVQAGHLIEIQKFVVGHHLRVIGGLGQQTGHHAGDRDGAEIFQHAHPLVALHHIKMVQVLHRLDGIPDALLQVGAAQGRPLVGKLALLLEHRIKAPGEGVLPQVVAGAVNELAGDLHHTQRLPAHGQSIRIFRQHPQSGLLPPGDGLLLLFEALAHCLTIFFQWHKPSPLHSDPGAARTDGPSSLINKVPWL